MKARLFKIFGTILLTLLISWCLLSLSKTNYFDESVSKIKDWYFFNYGKEFSVENRGHTPILNPRFINIENIDVSNNLNYFLSLARQKKHANRLDLLLTTWENLSYRVENFCSPGRQYTSVLGLSEILNGYGSGCCTHTNTAMLEAASWLGYKNFLIYNDKHVYSEILLNKQPRIVDPNLKLLLPSYINIPKISREPFVLNSPIKSIIDFNILDILNSYIDSQLIKNKDTYDLKAQKNDLYYNVGILNRAPFLLYPREKLVYRPQVLLTPLTNNQGNQNSSQINQKRARIDYYALINSNRQGVNFYNNEISSFYIETPWPIIAIKFHFPAPTVKFLKVFSTKGGELTLSNTLGKNEIYISTEDLSTLRSNNRMHFEIQGGGREIKAELILQFNQEILNEIETKKIRYVDDNDDCYRKFSLKIEKTAEFELGLRKCVMDNFLYGDKIYYFGLEKVIPLFKFSPIKDAIRQVAGVPNDGIDKREDAIYSNANSDVNTQFNLLVMPLKNYLLKVPLRDNLVWSVVNTHEWQIKKQIKLGKWQLFLITPQTRSKTLTLGIKRNFQENPEIILDYLSLAAITEDNRKELESIDLN